MDLSKKDSMYFIDGNTYNCPFCKRGHIRFSVKGRGAFDWNLNKRAHYFLVKCADCARVSFHLSHHNLELYSPTYGNDEFCFPAKAKITKDGSTSTVLLEKKEKEPIPLDELFFFHQPSSAFTVNSTIPEEIRTPLVEASDCLHSNFLTGASAALRKAIYKLLRAQKISDRKSPTEFLRTNERLELLKGKCPTVEPEQIDALKTAQGVASQELHENDWENLKAEHVRFLIEMTRVVLDEIYVVPEEKNAKKRYLEDLRKKALPDDTK